jgi:protein CpxP
MREKETMVIPKKEWFVLIILCFIVAFTNCQKPPHPEKMINRIFDKVADEIDATETQKTDLNRIKEEIKAKRRELKVGMLDFPGEAFAEQIRSNKMDEAKLTKLIQEKTLKEEQLKLFALKKFTEFHSSMTTEQRMKLADQIIKLQSKFKDRE